MRISIDFDGCIVENAYPKIGALRTGAKAVINKLYNDGHKILINTCRAGVFEGDVYTFLNDNKIKYHYINSNLPSDIEKYGQDCRKISADIYIDDKNILGIPSWMKIYQIICNYGEITKV